MPSPSDRSPVLPKPEIFVPAPPTLTVADAALLLEPPVPGATSSLRPPERSVVAPSERTTATSRVTTDANGKGTAELYAKPAFRRQGGRWVEVDSTLRPSARPTQPVAAEGALRPVRFGTSAERIVELGLDQGPVTLSAPGLALGKPTLEGDTVVYADVAKDTDLRYVVGDEGIKEELVLRSPTSPRSFRFHLADPSGQLGTPTRDGSGTWTFPNPIEEGVVLSLPPALAWPQGAEGEPVAADPASATMDLVPAGDGWDLNVAVNPTWLSTTTFPVVLDPTLNYNAAYGTGPTMEGYAVRQSGGCGGSCLLTRDSYLFAGSWSASNPVRSYLRYDLSAIPADARIDDTSLRLYSFSCMVVRTPDPCATKNHYIGLHRMNANWYSWSDYDDLAAASASSPFTPWLKRSAGSAPKYYFWGDGLTAQVQRWVDGADPNYGFAVRSLDETPDEAGPAYYSSRANTSRRPSLTVAYTVVAPNSPEVAAFAGNGAARVHWGIPNSGGAPITSYLIKTYRSGTYVSSKTITCPCPSVAAIEGLTNASTYSFSVQARNSVGLSAAATSATVTPSASLPTVPAPASAGPGNGAATATWSHPSTGAGEVDAYVVQVYDPELGYLGEATATCPCATTLGIGGLANAKVYLLAVYAHNDAGYSVPSVTGVVTPSSARPGAPRQASAQGSPGQIQLAWLAPSSGPAPSGYTLIPYDSLTGEVVGRSTSITCPCSSLSATISGLAPGRTYVVAVKATTSAGPGSPTLSPAVTLPGVPTAPGSLRAMPGDGAAVVAWDPGAANGSPVTGYTLTASPGGASTTVAGDITAAAFEGLDNGTAYSFTAVATNAVGDSAASLPSNEVTPSGDRGLLAPRNVVATRGDTEAHVAWDDPSVNFNLLGILPPLTEYTVTTHLASDGSAIKTTGAGDDTEVTVTGLKNGTPVYFTVTASSVLGLLNDSSGPSNTVTPAGPPFAPTDVVATRGDSQIDVSWLAPAPRPDGTPGDNGDPISSYTVTAYRASDNVEVTTVAAPASPTTVTGLVNGTAYFVRVTATNGVGVGEESSPSNTVTPAGPPFAPTGVTAVAGDGFADVSWTAPGDNGSPITGYTVVVEPGGRRVPVNGGATSTTVTSLDNGTTYTFTVVASNDAGDSSPSAASNPVTPVGPPSTPTNVVATAGETSATLNWDPSDANGAAVTYTGTSDPGDHQTEATGTTMEITDLAPGTTYTFTVVATNEGGSSPPSAPSNPVTPGAECTEEGAGIEATVFPPFNCNPVLVFECNNGEDDDGDGFVDFDSEGSGDPDCESANDPSESPDPEPPPPPAPECSNTIDDDGDGAIDFPADSGCSSAGDTTEANEIRDDPRYQEIEELTRRIQAGEEPFGSDDQCTGSGEDVQCPGESVTIPIPASSPSCAENDICIVTVHELLEGPAALLFEVIDQRDLSYLLTVVFGRNQRECRDGQTGQFIPGCISNHSFGTAIDFRAFADNEPGRWDQLVADDPNVGQLIDTFAELGWRWGGNFPDFDPQHFEFIGLVEAAKDLDKSQARGYRAP